MTKQITLNIIEISEQIIKISDKIVHSLSQSDLTILNSMVENLEMKMKSYEKTINTTQIIFLEEQDSKKQDQLSRMKNVRISDLIELENEETKSLAIKFFVEDLHLSKSIVVQAFRIGTKWIQPIIILVRFVNQAQQIL